ncbi:MAG: hypothetical protein ABIS25_08480 [Sphingomicrobium sp.]
MNASAIGAPATVKAATDAFLARTGADELTVTAQIFDPAARIRSYEIPAELYLKPASSAPDAEPTLAFPD